MNCDVPLVEHPSRLFVLVRMPVKLRFFSATASRAFQLEQPGVVLNFSIGPKMTYNEFAAKLDSIIRGFR